MTPTQTAITLFAASYVFVAVMFFRVLLVHVIRMRCIRLNPVAFYNGPSAPRMLWNLRAWTFKQFYPNA